MGRGGENLLPDRDAGLEGPQEYRLVFQMWNTVYQSLLQPRTIRLR